MKRTLKLCLALAGGFLMLGLVCTAVGALMGGRADSDRYFREKWSGSPWDDALERVEDLFDHAEQLDRHQEELLGHIPGSKGSGSYGESGGTYPISLDDITAVQVDVDCADIRVQEGETPSVDLNWNLSNYAIGYEIEEGTLKVTSESWGHSQLPDNFHIDCTVLLTLPAGTRLDRLELSTDMGDVEAQAALTVNEAELSTDLGDVICQNLLADTLEAETDLGDVELHLPGKRADYYWELETNMGELSIDGEKQSGGMGELFCRGGNGEKQIEAGSSLGNVELWFS